MKATRLQKVIADSGMASRRKAERWILEGRVQVNGSTVTQLGTKVSPNDIILVDDNMIDTNPANKIYILLNKPRGHITTVWDPEKRKTVMDLIPSLQERVYPVGRLDYLSEGLLLLTNDGELCHKMAHPRHGVIKVYEVKVAGHITRPLLKKLRAGALIAGEWIVPYSVRIIGELPQKTWLEFRVGEGKNRELRKFCEYHGLMVDKLKRVAVGGLNISGVGIGKYRFLTKKNVLKALEANAIYLSPKKSLPPTQ